MKILALLGIIQGLLLCLFFYQVEKNKAANQNILIGILLSICYMLLFLYADNPFIENGNIPLKLLLRILLFPIPVFFYFYFRFLATGEKNYRKWDLLHTLPTLFAFIAVIFPYLSEAKTSPNAILTNSHSLTFAQSSFHFIFFQSMAILLYAKLSLYSIFDLKLEVFAAYSNLLEKEKKWLMTTILGMFIVGFLGLLSTGLGLKAMENPILDFPSITNYIYVFFCAIALSFYWISYKAIQQPELFRPLATFMEKKEKYSHSGMTAEQAALLATSLKSLMETEALYLEPNLKLTDVANQLNSSPKVLSQLINQHFQQNFYDFVNSYRIAVAKTKLVNPDLVHLSIQGIAFESGFKSKSTFYSLFKKSTGMTPTQFQKSSSLG